MFRYSLKLLSALFVLLLLAACGGGGSTPSVNQQPVADAGPNQTVLVGDNVVLDGSSSSDANGDSLTFAWTISSAPNGSVATLSDSTAVNPQFQVDLPGVYVVQLIVDDRTVQSIADTVTITTSNSAPVSQAGTDQTVRVGTTVLLNGSGSSDVDGDSLNYTWSFVAIPVGSSALLSDIAAINPGFDIDLPGRYEVQLIVNDSNVDSAPDQVIIDTENSPPIADAGTNQASAVGETVQLDGSSSSDVDGDLLNYRWSFVSRPAGSGVILSSNAAVTPSFDIDIAGLYVIQLIVNDNTVDSDPGTVSVTTNNSAPVANAGLDQSVFVGETVLLDGSASSDPDLNGLNYSWSLISVPAGSGAILVDATSAMPSFMVDLSGSYVAQLIVDDSLLDSAPDTIIVTTENSRPVADAGADQQVMLGETVMMDGRGSTDADNDFLDYSWALIAKPGGSTTAFAAADTVAPTADPDLTGLYVAQLIVSDPTTDSAPDTAIITVDPEDRDNDGLSNGQEAALGTDPDNADSDADGLNDGDEIAQGTDPLAGDSDGDGLSDFEELNNLGTNPLASDSDGDGFTDSEELSAGSDPNNSENIPPGPGANLTKITTSPAHGEGDVAVTRETIVRFSRPLAATAVIDENVLFAEFGGELLAARVHVADDRTSATLFYNAPLPPSARVRVTLHGDGLLDENGDAVDANGNGVAGGSALIDFDTLTLTSVAGTAICGRVFASELVPGAVGGSVNTPLAGVKITVDGLEESLFTTTDQNGNFRLDNAPAGKFFVHIDGRTATASIPAGAYYPFVGKAWKSVAGEETTIGSIHLPLVQPATLQPVSDTQETVIEFPDVVLNDFPDFSGVSITVPAGALFNDDGTSGGAVGIAPVDPDRLPGTLPDELQFPLVITVQTDGATNFDEPVEICFPNLPHPETGEVLAPGEKTALWSFNHDVGRFEIAGSMTISADGTLACSDPGSGVRAPGWHGIFIGVTVFKGQIFDFPDSGLTSVVDSSGAVLIKQYQGCTNNTPNNTPNLQLTFQTLRQAALSNNSSNLLIFDSGTIDIVRGPMCESQQETPEKNCTTRENGLFCDLISALEDGPEEPQKEEAEEEADPVYLFSGEFYENQTDLRIKGRGMDFVWARKYRSKIPLVTELGHQWDYNYNIKLAALENGNIVLFDGATRQDEYRLQSDGTWTKRQFFRAISENADNTFTLTFESTSVWGFLAFDGSPAQGKIAFIQDRNGNRISFAYNVAGQLAVITDTLGRDITVTHNALGLIESVTDFTGRTVSYAYYDGTTNEGSAGDLRSVTSPAVSGTPNGNDFPTGKTTTYTYTTGVSDARLAHNLLTITDGRRNDANDTTFGDGPYLINSYATTTDPTSLNFDRVASQIFGGARIDLVYEAQTPSVENNQAAIKTIATDRVGNVSEYYWDIENRGVLMREYTGQANASAPTTSLSNRPVGKLRATDPLYFETRTEHNDDALPIKITYPNGNIVEYVYESELNSSADARSRRNIRIKRQLPGAHVPAGDQAFIQESYEYDPVFNFVTKQTDGRGNDTQYTYDANGNRISTIHRINSIVEDFEYNAFGQMTARVLPDNGSNRRRDEYVYYGSGAQLGYLEQAIIDAGNLNLTTAYEYDLVGNVVRKTDPRGQDTQYTVNQLDQVVRRTSREVGSGQTTRYQRDIYYDANNNVVRRDIQNIDDQGALQANTHFTTTYEHEILDRLTRTTQEVDDSRTIVTEYEYDANRNRTLARSGQATNGSQTANVVRTAYDERDLPFQVTRASGDAGQSTMALDYDLNGNLATTNTGIEDAAPRVARYQYDGYNRAVSTIDAMGNVVNFSYDANHNRVTQRVEGELTDLTGSGNNVRLSHTTTAYDPMDRETWRGVAFFDSQNQTNIGNGLAMSQTFYSDTSQVIRLVDDNNNQTRISYDTANRRAQVTDHKGNTTSYAYDANSNLVAHTEVEKSDLGNADETFITTQSYDNLDRLVRKVDNAGNIHEYRYDSRYNLTQMIDALRPDNANDPGNITRYSYDGLNRLLATTRVLTDDGTGAGTAIGDITTRQEWDDNSRLIARIDDNGNRTSYRYDSLNRRIALRYADGTEMAYAFDVHNNIITSTDANGNVVTNSHDLLNRVVTRAITPGAGVSNDTTSEAFKYDGLSRLVYGQDNDSLITRDYDSLSRVISETLNGQQTAASFDGVGNQLTLRYPGGRQIETNYDELNRKQTITDNNGLIASYSYIGPYRNEQRDYANNTRSEWAYDNVKRIVGTTHTKAPGASATVFDNRAYSWDRMFNKTSRQDLLPSGLKHDYRYDAVYRLEQSEKTLPVGAPVVVDYNLDGVGNRTSVIGGAQPGSYTLDNSAPEPADFQTNQYSTTAFDQRLYDRNGNLITIDNALATQRSLTYDYRNRFVAFNDLSAGSTSSYRYDVLGRRIEKRVDDGSPETTRYFYDGWRVVEEQNETNATQATYVYGHYIDEVLTMQRNGQDYFYHTDDMYNVMKVSDSAAAVVEKYEYGDYGESFIFDDEGGVITQSAVGNPYLFNGRRYDQETGYYYYRTRYMDANSGTFINRDSIGIWADIVNLGNGYTYVGSNPWTYVDFMGESTKKSHSNFPCKRVNAFEECEELPTDDEVKGKICSDARNELEEGLGQQGRLNNFQRLRWFQGQTAISNRKACYGKILKEVSGSLLYGQVMSLFSKLNSTLQKLYKTGEDAEFITDQAFAALGKVGPTLGQATFGNFQCLAGAISAEGNAAKKLQVLSLESLDLNKRIDMLSNQVKQACK